MTLRNVSDGVYLDDIIIEDLKNIDAIIFDCDGVLIDITNSYDVTIQRVTSYFLKELENIESPETITPQIISDFKATGGFNDEVDVTYASILSLIAASRLKKSPKDFLYDVISNADHTGIKSVEKHLKGLTVDLSDIIKQLDYPGTHSSNPLYSTFDQMFYGPELYLKIFQKKSNFNEPGLIENDVILITKNLIKILKKRFTSKISIVSGRGIESIRYSLKDLLDEFDINNSVFLENESRDLAKPNPESLIRSFKGLRSSSCLYVGDSMEDLIMANEANKIGCKTIFCAIYGEGKTSDSKRKFFEEKNAPIIIKSIDLLPNTLNLV